MVFILDVNDEIGAHVRSHLGSNLFRSKSIQKSEFFQLCSYPTALAEITDIIMKASEKVDHFVGKNQCNQALVCAMR